MAPLATIRLATLSASLIFTLIVLGIAADLTSTSLKFLNVYFTFAALGIATAVLSLLTLPLMIWLDITRPGGPTSMIIVEMPWLFFLSILWLATGAQAAQVRSIGFWFACADLGDGLDSIDAGACHEMSALEAFAFLNWLLLMGYALTLLIMSLVAANRKQTNVWTSSVANAPFGSGAPDAGVGGTTTSTGGSYGGHAMTSTAGGHSGPTTYNTSGSVQAGTVH
ncbi:hypothetical protein R3P38DRAFT_2844201, partial [Favolaschia claudopus]